MLRGKFRQAYAILIFLVIASCSGGGCSSGCSGCGITPLPKGFPEESNVTNAASARVTRSGLDFLAKNAPNLAQTLLQTGGGGVLQFAVPTTPESFSIGIGTVDANICPNGGNPSSTPESCEIDIDIGNSTFTLDAVTPDAVTIGGTLLIRAESIDVDIQFDGDDIGNIYLGAGDPSTLTCNGNQPASSSSNPFKPVNYVGIPFTATLPLVADTIAPRVGYTKIDATNMTVNVSLGSSDFTSCSTCGAICDDIVDGLIDVAFALLNSTIQGFIQSAVAGELCTKASTTTTPACPDGSVNVSGTCMYGPSNSACLPLELGTEGHIDLSTALASISPGTAGALDFVFASAGDMIPANAPSAPTGSPADNNPYSGHTPNGITLGFLGGALPSPQSECVPKFNNVIPTGIPIPDLLKENAIMPWPGSDPTGPMFGLAIAGRFLNYAFGTVYNSGLLCLGVSTASEQVLTSGLLSVLVPSVRDLTFEEKTAAVAVTTRPQKPPTVVLGGGTDIKTDPLLKVSLDQFAVDFYVFSDDRFVRAFTYTADLTIPVNLSTAVSSSNPTGGLLPQIGAITASSASVTNAELMLTPASQIASGVTGILGAAASMFTGSISPIDISSDLSSLGLTLTIPDGGIRKITQGTDDYLAILGDIGLVSPMPLAHVDVTLTKKTVDPTALTLGGFDRAKLPSLAVHRAVTDAGEGPYEYAYWIDKASRSAWSTDPDEVVQNDMMYMQGHHTLYVSARRVGVPASETTTPAELPFTVDVLPPEITVGQDQAGNATVAAWDFVSTSAELSGRYQVINASGVPGAWTAWQPIAAIATIDKAIAAGGLNVQVKDGEGNVGQVITPDLIRGRPDPGMAASSCNCSTPGTGPGVGAGWAIGLALLFVAAAVRRLGARAEGGGARVAAAVGLAAVAIGGALSEGCSCGSSGNFNGNKDAAPEAEAGAMCGPTCNAPCSGSLPQGLVGAYTSTAKSSDGTYWVAGYNDSAINKDYSGLYGDLVVGKYDTAKSEVMWVTVDGVPALPKGTCPDYDPTGWRGGVTSEGDDVGLWTSVQMDANDHPIVSYYDATNQALKFASSSNGTDWKTHTVMQATGSDIGRYGKMLVIGGVPTIAFLIMEPGSGGKLRSKVELATAKTKTPSSASDWSFEDAAIDNNGPCRAAFCKTPAVCIAATGQCEAPVSGCSGACDGGVCVDTDGGPSCQTPLAANYIDIYPNAFGDYIAMANGPNGLGIVVYDRIDGLLEGVYKSGSSWKSEVIDGWTNPRPPSNGPDGGLGTDTGDVGVGASLYIAANGDWHISYVNGTTEALQYILVAGGTKTSNYPEIVDNGLSLDGTPFADGLHIVGDDSWIMVSSDDVVTIRYQDATSGTLRYATGAPQSGGKHSWSFHAVSQPGLFAGFFPHQLAGETNVANWWRKTDPSTGDISGNVSFVNPN